MNITKIQERYFGFYNWGKRKLIARSVHKTAQKYLENPNILTKEEKRQIEEFWSPYGKVDPIYHAFFKEKSGMFHPQWLPTDIYINVIDEYFNDRNATHVMDDKSLYSRLFLGVPQIEVFASRMGGLWYDADLKLIPMDEVKSIVEEHEELFVKAATRSYGGKGVQYLSKQKGSMWEQLQQAIKMMPGNIVIQKSFRQHPVYKELNPSSVNTLRIISLLTENGAKIYSAVVRMGIGEAKVDNASAGGIFCGIREDHTLKDTAYRLTGESFKTHPTNGLVFEGYQLVGYDKAEALVKQAHPLVPYFRLVSWDVAIDENGDAFLLEANLAKGCLDFHQLTRGPLFGEDTKAILDDVFGKKNSK